MSLFLQRLKKKRVKQKIDWAFDFIFRKTIEQLEKEGNIKKILKNKKSVKKRLN